MMGGGGGGRSSMIQCVENNLERVQMQVECALERK